MIAEARQPASFTRRTPIRGTQSFVGIMAAVWRRPSLVAIEVLWRWSAGIPLLAVCAWEILRRRGSVVIDTSALRAMTVFRPVQAGLILSATAHALAPVVLPLLLWIVPSALLLRTACAALGRTAMLRRLQPGSHPERGRTFALSALRTGALLVVLTLWAVGVRWANAVAITGPTARSREPDVVLFAALVVFGTLALFVAWALSIGKLDARLFRPGSHPPTIHGSRTLRSQLIEMNLVMGIVKVALIVLAMVFSACPLPFETVESVAFLTWWCIGVGVLYLLASDFFHVVRAAYCVAMLRLQEAGPER